MSERSCRRAGVRGLVGGLVLLLLAGRAAAISYGEIEVFAASEPRGNAGHGYVDYRLVVRHRGTDRDRVVALTVPAEAGFGRGRGMIQAVSRRVIVEPGKTVTVSLLVPAQLPLYGGNAAVRIDGRLEEQKVPLPGVAYGYRGSGALGNELVLLSRRVPDEFMKPVLGSRATGGMALPIGGPRRPVGARPVGAAPAPPEPGTYAIFHGQEARADQPISTWSRHWLGFSRYDGIVLTRDDLAELAAGGNETRAVLEALWQYAEVGGSLLVLPGDDARAGGTLNVPPGWRRYREKRKGFDAYPACFGLLLVGSERDSARWPLENWQVVVEEWQRTARPFTATGRTMESLNESLPVVDDLGVPVRGLFGVMIVFALLIGPGNLWLLARKNRRIWLLWTVPAVSMVTCFAVFAYMIIAEGWQGHAQVAGLTILDEVERRAATVGRTAYYSPMTPGGGLRFSGDTEVQIQGNEHSALRSACTVDWTEGQHLARGWVGPRVPAHFMHRKSEPRRERVTLRREGDRLYLVNALGANITSIHLLDEKGELYAAGEVQAGEKALLEPVRKKKDKKEWRSLYSGVGDWVAASMKGAKEAPWEYLRPGTYLAVVEGSPFLEHGLRGARVRNNESVVLGLMAPEAR
jgi:hypothetical protein